MRCSHFHFTLATPTNLRLLPPSIQRHSAEPSICECNDVGASEKWTWFLMAYGTEGWFDARGLKNYIEKHKWVDSWLPRLLPLVLALKLSVCCRQFFRCLGKLCRSHVNADNEKWLRQNEKSFSPVSRSLSACLLINYFCLQQTNISLKPWRHSIKINKNRCMCAFTCVWLGAHHCSTTNDNRMTRKIVMFVVGKSEKMKKISERLKQNDRTSEPTCDECNFSLSLKSRNRLQFSLFSENAIRMNDASNDAIQWRHDQRQSYFPSERRKRKKLLFDERQNSDSKCNRVRKRSVHVVQVAQPQKYTRNTECVLPIGKL